MGLGAKPLLKNRWFWVAAVLVLVLDRLTKFWVEQTFTLTTPPESWPIIPDVFHFTYVINTGAAFSMFQNSPWLRWLSLLVSLGLALFAIFGPRLMIWEAWGYGLLLGGALGNGVDRFAMGHVTDFLEFRLINFPVFNIADVAINIGIGCLAIATYLISKRERQEKLAQQQGESQNSNDSDSPIQGG